MTKHCFAPQETSAASKAHMVALVCWFALLSGINVLAQSTTGNSPANWKTYTTSEKEFSFSMPETAAIFRRGPHERGTVTISEMTDVGAFYQGCAMNVLIFKTSDPQGVMQMETQSLSLRNARRTELKGRGVKAYSFVGQKDGVHFEALALLNKKQLYLLQAGAREENNVYLKQFLASVSLAGMTSAAAPPATVNNASPPSDATTPEEPLEAATPSLRPIVIYAPKALYTNQARTKGLQGTILVSAVFTSLGEITHIRILRGLPDGLDQEAIFAAQRIRFLPALKNGKPVSVRMSMEFSFNLL